MSWATIQNGLQAWVKSATGFDDAHVIWADQSGPRPDAPFIDLRIGTTIPLGAIDELSDNTDLTRDPGSEVELRATCVQEFHLTVRCFTAATLDDSAATALLGRARLALTLPSIRDALETAGVTIFDRGEVQNVSVLKDVKFEGRAMLDVGCYTLEAVSEFVGYIDEVDTVSYLGPPDLGTDDEIDI